MAEFDYSEADKQSDDVVRLQAEYLLQVGLKNRRYPNSPFGRTRKQTAIASALFLALRKHTPPSLGQIAADSGIPRGTVTSWCTRDKGFREALAFVSERCRSFAGLEEEVTGAITQVECDEIYNELVNEVAAWELGFRMARGEEITREDFVALPWATRVSQEEQFGPDWITDMMEIALEKRGEPEYV